MSFDEKLVKSAYLIELARTLIRLARLLSLKSSHGIQILDFLTVFESFVLHRQSFICFKLLLFSVFLIFDASTILDTKSGLWFDIMTPWEMKDWCFPFSLWFACPSFSFHILCKPMVKLSAPQNESHFDWTIIQLNFKKPPSLPQIGSIVKRKIENRFYF